MPPPRPKNVNAAEISGIAPADTIERAIRSSGWRGFSISWRYYNAGMTPDLKELNRRQHAFLQRSVAPLETAARGTENLMPKIVPAAQASATAGEISDALRRVFGEYQCA